jgi:hypothetical protein
VLAPRPFIRTRDYFGPDRRRSQDTKYSGPERRKGSAGAEVIEIAPIDNRLQVRKVAAEQNAQVLQPETAA